MWSTDENLLLYAGASLDELTDELHERRAENGVFLVTRQLPANCHGAPAAWLGDHVGVARFGRRVGVARHRVVELGEEGEEHLKEISRNCFLLETDLNAPD